VSECIHPNAAARLAERDGVGYQFCDPRRGGCGLAQDVKSGGAWAALPPKAKPTKPATSKASAGGSPKSMAALSVIHEIYERGDADERKDVRAIWHDMTLAPADHLAVLKARDAVHGSHVALLDAILDAVDAAQK
jgi:hypothetical protein